VLDLGGSVEALGFMKERLVERLAQRLRAIESGERVVVGVNRFEEGEPSPLAPGEAGPAVERIDLRGEQARSEAVARWREGRDGGAVSSALDDLRRAAESTVNLMEATLGAVRAGVTTGEWAGALRDVFGSYRAPTGLSGSVAAPDDAGLADARSRVAAAARRLGVDRLRLLVAKPGLDGHSNAAEQVALRARDAGFEVIYQGIRLTPTEVGRAAADEDVHAVGLSVLSGAHMVLVPDVLDRLREEGVDPGRVPVVVGGPIDASDATELCRRGVARVFTPFDGSLTTSVAEVADLVAAERS
jgi:(2R)-ethylmalonyl-CoA mutase